MSIKSNSPPRVALVTGAAGSIGSSVVKRLSHEGWKIAGIDLKKADADLFLPADVTDRAAMKQAATRIADELGAIGLLVTAAGDHEKNAIGDMAPARWQRMLDVWLGGATNACAAVVPQMIEAGRGTVVLLSSDPSSDGKQNSYIAAASGTVIAFAKSFGCEVAADGVCVNCIVTRSPVNPEPVARTINFLANDGHYYAGQVMFINSHKR
ncbi:MAG: SDR family NAD(P)-dependent oxidoreductase [bacterium]|nr:SDR family NAD(P)-dependent oxidoreductase [bacterium]